MLKVFDDLDRELVLGRAPRRIVSLVPSETFNVVALGAGERLVGRTDYCVHPEGLAAPAVGGTKDPRVDDVLALEPDLVLANKEENSKGDLERIVAAGVKVFVSFPRRVADGLAHLGRLARILGTGDQADVKARLRAGYHALREAEAARATTPPLRVFVPIWMDPLMTIHGDTFLSDLLDLVGLQNVFADRRRRYPLAADLGRAPPKTPEQLGQRDTRYPRVTLDEVVARAPEIILLPDEPHPFDARDAEVFRALDVPAARDGRVIACAGRDLSWPGAQALDGLPRVRALVERWRGARG